MSHAYNCAGFDSSGDITRGSSTYINEEVMAQPELSKDTELVKLIRAGNVAAFREIFDIYAKPLLRFANSRLNAPERAEDIVQQVFASLWARRERWEVSTSIAAYLFSAVRNLIAREFRDRGIRDRALDDVPELVDLTMGKPVSPASDLSEADLQAALKRAVEAMPARPREVFRMSRELGMTYLEISAALGVSVKTVELHMTRALAALRAALADWR